mmetsp:Transcript_10720/g.36401  ORF Transcript_10720/g.36401 Transcript_10720/m.36401 type:complete len:221 (+) Transcript_10720:601-1263(+)
MERIPQEGRAGALAPGPLAPRLSGGLREGGAHAAVGLPEAHRLVPQARAVCRGRHAGGRRAERVPGQPREEVVHHLVLEATVEPVHARGTGHVHGAGELHAPPRVLRGAVGDALDRVPAEVGEGDLHVQHARDGHGGQQEGEGGPRPREAPRHAPRPDIVQAHPQRLERARARGRGEEVEVRLQVEVHLGHGHHGVVERPLAPHEHPRRRVKGECPPVVG